MPDFPRDIQQLQTYFLAANSTTAVRPTPGEGFDVPIYSLGSSTDSAYLAAALGLPYAFASHFAPAQLRAALELYRPHFRPSASWRRWAGCRLFAGCPLVILVVCADSRRKSAARTAFWVPAAPAE